ncbi:MAG: hypothetical protein HEQ37_18585 [Acidovorax sp.]|nr:hypothetical protein [Acidovorax sp.]
MGLISVDSVEKLDFGPHREVTLNPQRSELSSFPDSFATAAVLPGFTPLS